MTLKEIQQELVDSHIAAGYGTSDGVFVRKTYKAFGVEVELCAFSAHYFTYDLLKSNDLVKIVEDSFAELQVLTKKVGKNCSGRTIQELRKLNPRNWLLGI